MIELPVIFTVLFLFTIISTSITAVALSLMAQQTINQTRKKPQLVKVKVKREPYM